MFDTSFVKRLRIRPECADSISLIKKKRNLFRLHTNWI